MTRCYGFKAFRYVPVRLGGPFGCFLTYFEFNKFRFPHVRSKYPVQDLWSNPSD